MKPKFTLAALGLFMASTAFSQTARVQAIHNCPDPAAATVDVWINDQLLLPGFQYKEASPYINAPAMVNFDLSITAPGAVDTVGAIFKKTFNLSTNSTNVVVASGGLAETGATAFDLRAYVGQEQATNQGMGEVSLNVIHGSYDAPMVDIHEVQVPAGELVPDLSFGEDVGAYVNLGATDYDVQIKAQTGEAVIEFDADLSSLADSAVIVMATGYLDPSSAVGTEPFGLLAILPDGTVIPLSSQAITPARLQVIHNCAATDAAMVDVWLNDGAMPLLDDFAFRTASPFINAPAGEFFDVSIALPTSMDTTGALYRETFILESNRTYIVVASGTVGSGTYSPATPFSLEVIANAREMAADPMDVDVIVWHGATDAPMVDVVESQVGAGTIVDDISYGEAQGYLELTPADYDLNVTDMSGATTLFSYDANLSAFTGAALTVLASGFVDPSANNNASAFGLWVASGAGGALIELTNITSVEDLSTISNIVAYPNPAVDVLNISLDSEQSGDFVVSIFSSTGQLIQQTFTQVVAGNNQLVLDVNDLSKGTYIIQVSDNNSSSTMQFVK